MRLVIVMLAVLLVGCEPSGEVAFVGVTDFTFNGMNVDLPNNGKGQHRVTPATFDFEWGGKTLNIEDLKNGTVSVTTPKTKGQVVPKDHKLSIDDEGNVSTTKSPL